MKILFDHQVFAWQRTGGISRYFAELVHGLAAEALLPPALLSSNIYLEEKGMMPSMRERFPNFKGKKILQLWWGRRASLRTLKTLHPSVFHPTYFDDYFLQVVENQNIPFVLTVHDMIHERFQHGHASWFSLDRLVIRNKRKLCRHARAIVAVSHATREDLLHFFPEIDPQKVHVVWHGNSLAGGGDTLPVMALPDGYLLFVGSRGGYKNFDGLLQGTQAVLKKYPDLHLIFAGGGEFTAAEIEQLRQVNILGQTRLLPCVSDAELSELYRRALCLVFPSKYEGFGIPILESFACGCPVVAHRVSSLPEIGGDAALYFEENDTDQLAQVLENVIVSSELRASLRHRGWQRLSLFSWQNSVAAHRKIYQSVLT